MSVNRIILIGFLGENPETKTTKQQNTMVYASLATTETWTDKVTGEKKKITEWHKILFFDRLAEIASQYLQKGSQIYIEGKLRTRKWQDHEGVEHHKTEIICEKMQMLGNKQKQKNDDTNNEHEKEIERYKQKILEPKSDMEKDIDYTHGQEPIPF